MTTADDRANKSAGNGPVLSRRSALSAGGAVVTGLVLGGWSSPQAHSAKPADNLIPNGGFEKLEDGFPAFWTQFNARVPVLRETTRTHSGANAVRLSDTSDSSGLGLRSAAATITPGKTYEASVFAWIESGSPAIFLEFWDEAGTRIGRERDYGAATDAWQVLTVEAPAPDGAVGATVLLASTKANVGEAVFDDVTLQEVVPVEPDIEFFGAACPSVSLNQLYVAARAGDATTLPATRGYFVTRKTVPAILGEYDLETRKVTQHAELPNGDEAWAITVSGEYVFAGMNNAGTVHRFRPADGRVDSAGRLGSATYVWDLATAPDGVVYAVTYPDGRLWEINPDTLNVRDMGTPVPGATYGRWVTANSTHIFGSFYTPGGSVVAVDRATGEVSDITPSRPEPGTHYGQLRFGGGRLFINGGGFLIDMLPDGTDERYVSRPADQRSTNWLEVTADDTVYLSVLPAGTVYRYQTGDTELTPVATPQPEMTNRCLHLLDERTLFGATVVGTYWYLNLDTKQLEEGDLGDAGMPTAPQRPHSLAVDHSRRHGGPFVLAGSTGRIFVHRPTSRETYSVNASGEPKGMVVANGKVYAAMYPSTQILELDPVTRELRALGNVRNQQYRPRVIAYDDVTGLLAVATGAIPEHFTGALTFIDPTTDEFEVHRELLPNQGVTALHIADGIAYLGGSVLGEGKQPGPESTASILAYDIARRRILWRADPLNDHKNILSVTVHDGVVYGMYSRPAGVWFAYDIARQKVIHQGKINGGGKVVGHRGRVFATDYVARRQRGWIHQIGPDLEQSKVVVRGLEDLWGVGLMSPEKNSWYAWAVPGGQLARVNIDPR